MNDNKNKFLIITLCEKFLCRFCETLKGCDKEYRETIVRDLYLDIKKLMCTVQYANDRLKRGSPKRPATILRCAGDKPHLFDLSCSYGYRIIENEFADIGVNSP